MRVAIDATSVPARPAGAGVYAIELVRALAANDVRGDGYTLFTRGNWFDRTELKLRPYDAESAAIGWRVERVGAGSRAGRLAWEQMRLPGRLEALGIDVLHSTHHTLPLRPTRCRRVVTLHDVTFFRLPARYPAVRRFYVQTMTRLAARAADAIIVPSNAVREDVLRWLRPLRSKVSVVYEAPRTHFAPVPADKAAAIARRYTGERPYVVSVGSLEPGKNRARLIHAMHLLRDEGFPHRLLIAGQRAWGYEPEFALVRQLGMEDRVVFAGYVPEGDLPALYSAASAFAFPSLYEGFGLPVLEAMACGTPVLTSNISATAEVAGDAALLVDPTSVDAVACGLRRLLSDPALREDVAQRGLARAGEFSWARAAEETRAVYRSVGQRAPAG